MLLSMGSAAIVSGGVSDIRNSGFAAFPYQGIPAFVTLTEAAKMLGFDRRFVVKWLKDRKIVVVDYLEEDEPLFLRAEVIAYINSRHQMNAEPETHRQTSKSSSLEAVNNESFANTELACEVESLGQYEALQQASGALNSSNTTTSQINEPVLTKYIAEEHDKYKRDITPEAHVSSPVQLRNVAHIVSEIREVPLNHAVSVGQIPSIIPTASAETSAFSEEQHEPEVKDNDVTDHLSSGEKFKQFIESLPHGTHAVPGYKYIKVRVNKGVTVIEVVVKGKPNNHKRILLKHKHTNKLEEHDLALVIEKYRFFLEQHNAKRLFEQINWLPHSSKTRITTMKQLLAFEIENKNWSSDATLKKAKRMFSRYIAGKEGDLDLRYAKTAELNAIFIENAATSTSPSDRDELIKRIKAAYSFAYNHPNVEKLDFPKPLETVKRNRENIQHQPELQTYVDFISKAIELGLHDLALVMLLQEQVFTRFSLTASLTGSDINLGECSIAIKGHKHKNQKNGYYYFPPNLITLFKEVIENRTRISENTNCYLFPGVKCEKFNKSIFYDQLNIVREALHSELDLTVEAGFSERLIEINEFRFHRIRNLNEKLLTDINVREAEAENAHNRRVDDRGRAYADLSPRRQREFKAIKFEHICRLHPEYYDAICRLTAHYRSN